MQWAPCTIKVCVFANGISAKQAKQSVCSGDHLVLSEALQKGRAGNVVHLTAESTYCRGVSLVPSSNQIEIWQY
jgi:hypothetical protein